METEVYVWGARRYKFADKETGELRAGVKLWFSEPSLDSDGDRVGFRTDAVSVPFEWWDRLQEVPGRYRFVVNVSLRGRPEIRDMEYAGSVDVRAVS